MSTQQEVNVASAMVSAQILRELAVVVRAVRSAIQHNEPAYLDGLDDQYLVWANGMEAKMNDAGLV